MSVIISHLTKAFGEQLAVNDISFTAAKGQVLGLLGPNGAGKTTTMKILTCYIPQTSGQASVSGYDVREAPMEVRKRIGYLPENNPLYPDMYVREYLQFIAEVHRLDKKKSRIENMIDRTGLGLEQNKKIGALSKGFRQRVGLAQALIHDPEVLILDEPTSGLDPNQLVEIRNLIKGLGKEKTVIFSTHIMQEVQAVCDQVVIINRGRMVANDPIEKIQDRVQGDQMVSVEFMQAVQPQKLNQINGVINLHQTGDKKWTFVAKGKKDIRADIFRFAVREELIILEMKKEQSSVEDVFQRLTKEKA